MILHVGDVFVLVQVIERAHREPQRNGPASRHRARHLGDDACGEGCSKSQHRPQSSRRLSKASGARSADGRRSLGVGKRGAHLWTPTACSCSLHRKAPFIEVNPDPKQPLGICARRLRGQILPVMLSGSTGDSPCADAPSSHPFPQPLPRPPLHRRPRRRPARAMLLPLLVPGRRTIHPARRPCRRPAGGASFASRAPATGLSGAAGTAHPLATLPAIEILKRGGSAVDAAVAIECLPRLPRADLRGIGGDCFVDDLGPGPAQGRRPRRLGPRRARSPSKHAPAPSATDGALPRSARSRSSVPGAVDAWWTLHQRYGKLPWADLFQPAIHLAEQGAPVPDIIAYYIKRNLDDLPPRPDAASRKPQNALHTWAPNGKTPSEGEMFRNPDLARTYGLIAAGRPRRFLRRARSRTPSKPISSASAAGCSASRSCRPPQRMGRAAMRPNYRGVDVHALGAEHAGHRDTADAQHHRAVRSAQGMGFQSPLSLHIAGRGQAPRLRGPRALLRRSALLKGAGRMADLEGLCRAARAS